MKEAGLGFHATVVKPHDGDTVTVEIKLQLPIRIRNLWSPELKEEGGQDAKEAVVKLLPPGSPCMVFVPSNNPLLLMDCVTLGRVLGDIYNQDGVDVADQMVRYGFGTKQKTKR